MQQQPQPEPMMPVVRTKRKVNDAVAKELWRRKKWKPMVHARYAFHEHHAAKRRAWLLWPVLVHLVGVLHMEYYFACKYWLSTHRPFSFLPHRNRLESSCKILWHKICMRFIGDGWRWNCHPRRCERRSIRYYSGKMAWNRWRFHRRFGRPKAIIIIQFPSNERDLHHDDWNSFLFTLIVSFMCKKISFHKRK